MEEKEKYFSCIASDNIREFVAELNAKKVTKEEIVNTFYNQTRDSYYALIYR
jgi:hypothetical protein